MKYQKIKDKFNEKTLNDSHGIDWDYFIEEIKDHKMYKDNINRNILKAIVLDLYIYQPKDFRDTILIMFMAKVGLNKSSANRPIRPEKCPECGSKWIQWFSKDNMFKCKKCSYPFDERVVSPPLL